jgi:hypothetical protein
MELGEFPVIVSPDSNIGNAICLVFLASLGLWQASAVMNALLKTLDNLST